mmetsp:Transcript_35505/g.106016  ORF Transcript_35505/g.106016 Transcript_35505/m.106016 type:complete len:126 (+) Transcript_35505:878-1255(+)
MVDDYNHWMGGLNLADQRIAYYAPNLCCRRTWMPMMLQMLNIIRNNAYVVHSATVQNPAMHKMFALDMVVFLRQRAAGIFLRQMEWGRRRAAPDGKAAANDHQEPGPPVAPARPTGAHAHAHRVD